jgi:5'-nucleotidase (lipoprotein e(P4) family)
MILKKFVVHRNLFVAMPIIIFGAILFENSGIAESQPAAIQPPAAAKAPQPPAPKPPVTNEKSTNPTAPAALKQDDPPHRGLDANLYMQSSAEYRACCLQAYNLATYRLKDAAKTKSDKPAAVIMDLDETVLDNSGFQAMQLRANLSFDIRLWYYWEEKCIDRVALVPGAKEFITEAEKLGVTLVYISNRDDIYKAQTKKVLERFSLALKNDDDLKLATTTSDKTSRMKEAETKYSVLLYVGDNLRDFSDEFKFGKFDKNNPQEIEQAVEARKKSVDAHRNDFGTKFIILPNSAYGEWLKPLGQGMKDFDRLVPEGKLATEGK